MKNNILISFIIPAYNCQNTISDCIESIQNCSYHNIEIIIINDCSTDNTLEVCNKLSLSDTRIKVFSNERNKGTSTTRNIGLNNTAGDYIWFVDSDDTIVGKFISDILSFITTHPKLDIICFNHYNKNFNGISESDIFKHNQYIINGVEYLKTFDSFYLWDKIYSKNIIGATKFIDGTKNIEDFYFNLNIIPKANKILISTHFGYNYNCTNQNSTSRNKNLRNLIKLSQDSILIHKYISKDIQESKNNEVKKILTDKLNFSIAGHFFSIIRFYNLKFCLKAIKEYKRLNLYPILRTQNRKANLLLYFINQEKVIRAIFNILKTIKL